MMIFLGKFNVPEKVGRESTDGLALSQLKDIVVEYITYKHVYLCVSIKCLTNKVRAPMRGKIGTT